jgi:hypothetical protein
MNVRPEVGAVIRTLGAAVSGAVERKVAVTVAAAVMGTVQVPVLEQPPPLQPENVEPGLAVALRVTVLVVGKLAEQVAPQLIPAGALVTVPLPVPLFFTVSVADRKSKVAVTMVVAVTVTVQAPVPVHPPPLQPEKTESEPGVAVRVTAVPLGYVPEQLGPQLMPPTELVTVPLPPPIFTTASPKICGVLAQATFE